MIAFLKPQFSLGRVVATPGALEALAKAGQTAEELLNRHHRGDWGDLDDTDLSLNDEALQDGSRLLSAYHLKTGVKIWVITEASDDEGKRSATTLLLPDEY
ncbi:MAG TPA: hypothetical protein VHC22_13430 [Pirellulales bacterium]|nr:hypothetical protein [Pirellulales bacterium]